MRLTGPCDPGSLSLVKHWLIQAAALFSWLQWDGTRWGSVPGVLRVLELSADLSQPTPHKVNPTNRKGALFSVGLPQQEQRPRDLKSVFNVHRAVSELHKKKEAGQVPGASTARRARCRCPEVIWFTIISGPASQSSEEGRCCCRRGLVLVLYHKMFTSIIRC